MPDRIFISPLARRIAEEYGIDYSKIKGSKSNGRIVKKDIEREMEALKSVRRTLDIPNIVLQDEAGSVEILPISRMRRTIAERLSQSKREIPHTYFKITADMHNVLKFKDEIGSVLQTSKGLKLSLTHIIMKAVSIAIEENKGMNVSYRSDGILSYRDVNIGMAVAVEGGLFVPVIEEANRKTLSQICASAANLAEKARAGKLEAGDVRGGTFTVTNLGMYGLEEFSAVINPPEAAILAVGALTDRPVAVKGEVLVRPMMTMVLSVDHRVIDGGLAARFLASLGKHLENPYSMLAL